MKRVERWQTKDGLLFEREISAAEHEHRLSFSSWYETHEFMDSDGYKADSDELLQWLEENNEYLIKFLGGAK